MGHIKEPLLLIGKSSLCGSSRFPLLLSEWSFTICPTPYNRKYNVLSASLNLTFLPSFGYVSYEVRSMCGQLLSGHFSKAAISIKISILLINFCSFDLFCAILEKDNFIEILYIVLSCPIK